MLPSPLPYRSSLRPRLDKCNLGLNSQPHSLCASKPRKIICDPVQQLLILPRYLARIEVFRERLGAAERLAHVPRVKFVSDFAAPGDPDGFRDSNSDGMRWPRAQVPEKRYVGSW